MQVCMIPNTLYCCKRWLKLLHRDDWGKNGVRKGEHNSDIKLCRTKTALSTLYLDGGG